MLVARRDPFHPGAHDAPLSEGGVVAHAVGVLPRLARTMSVLQMVGTLLAIPLGIASFYSMYRANFSVETSCQGLRANIVAMLDRSVDVRTRHMLVRRDVLAFEQRCGSFDPDATAAFKALLAQDTTAVAVAPVRRVEAKPAEGARKVERAEAKSEAKSEAKTETKIEAKSETKVETKNETKTVQREAAGSDVAWLAAVRSALTAHAGEPVQVGERAETAPVAPAPAKPALAAVPPIAQPVDRDIPVIVQVPAPLQTAIPAALPAPVPAPLRAPLPAAAASVPPVRHEPVAAAVTPVPGMQPAWNVPPAPAIAADVDHPVPPAFVPVIAPGQASAAPQERSRLGGLIAQLPFVGQMLERK